MDSPFRRRKHEQANELSHREDEAVGQRAHPAQAGHQKKQSNKGKQPAPESLPFSNYSGKIPLTIDQICDSLLALTDGWPKCVSGVLCYREGEELRVLEDPAALFAWVGGHARVDWRRGACAVTKEELFKRLRQRQRWEWATPHPHFPPVPGVCYLREAPEAEHTGKLDELLDRFRPKTPQDRELIRAMVLTLFWGGPPGKRLQFIIVADEDADADAGRGTGKTSLPQYLSELVGGCVDVDPGGDRGRTLSNLLSPSSWSRRVALIDNLKTARFSNDFLEKLVTCREITGHRLYAGFATRPNLLTFVVTVNGAYFSTDEAQRSVVIRLKRPPATASDWDGEILAFIKENRDAIVADIRWHLEVKKAHTLKKVDRWRPWCLGVLNRCQEPAKLLRHIRVEREAIDADKLEVELALDHLRGCIVTHFDEVEGKAVTVDNSLVWAPSAWLVQAIRTLKRDLTDCQAQQFLARLTSSPRLKECRHNSQRGYLSIGVNADPKDSLPIRVIVYRPEVPSSRRGR